MREHLGGGYLFGYQKWSFKWS